MHMPEYDQKPVGKKHLKQGVPKSAECEAATSFDIIIVAYRH